MKRKVDQEGRGLNRDADRIAFRPQLNRYPFWAPRFWHGLRLGDWVRLLLRHRFRVHPLRIPMAVIVTCIATLNSVLYRLQRALYGRRLDAVTLDRPPLFVIGHWRSGTTLLHEMLVVDDQFAYPTTYECFAANHFLVTGRFLPKLIWFLLPKRRPMDNMDVSFDHPQEDEFALISMGAPSPLLKMAFPNEEPTFLEFLDMEDVAASDLQVWKNKLAEFVRAQTLLKGKRLVLKSPPHTGRLAVLRQLFPGAQFVHIARDPRALFPSNQRLWIALDTAQGFQIPHHQRLDEFVFTAFERMYRGYEAQRASLPANALCEIRYEDLVASPIKIVESIYHQLNLGDFEAVRPELDAYLAARKGYQVNRHELSADVESEIRQRWEWYLRQFGYSAAR